MIDWLNANSGFVMALLTLVYVVATIVLAGLQRKTLEEVKRDREEREKPNVQLQVRVTPSGLIMFGIANYGTSPARSISIDFSDEFLAALPGQVSKTLENLRTASLHLAPKQEWFFGAMGKAQVEVEALPEARATITFRDHKGEENQVFWEFDFPSHGSILLRTTGIDQLTHELTKSLSKIENELKGIRRE